MARLPARIAIVYALVAVAFIVVGDVALLRGLPTADLALSTLNGVAFVIATAVVLYLLLRRTTRRMAAMHATEVVDRRRFEALVHGSSDIQVVLGRDGHVTFVSPAVTGVLGWTPEQVLNRDASTLIHPDDLAVLRADPPAPGVAPSGFLSDAGHTAVVRALSAAGTWRHIELTSAPGGPDPVLDGIVVSGRDVTDREAAQQALRHARVHDPVTGLRNRQGFERDLRDLGMAARAVGGAQLVVLAADVDRFREVNQEIGTEGGDEVLRLLGERVRAVCPAGGVTGHLGGDNLAIAFLNAQDRPAEAEVRLMAEGLRRRLGTDLTVRGHQFTLSVSCGAAVCDADAAPLEALLAAESMCTDAKALPDRTAIVVNPPSVHRDVRAPELHRAINDGQLRMHYQPQYSLQDGHMTGVEALIRWQHPERGLLRPSVFLDDAQMRGLQPAITRWVLHQACAFLASLDKDAGLTMSVNLSLDDLARHGLVAEVLETVSTCGIDTADLRLELTERALLVHPERSVQTMNELRRHGLTFSIDDFGTGFSSLEHLRTMPVDELKIDRSFVVDLSDPRSRAIVGSVIDLGRQIGLDLVAEGIEDAETVGTLVEMGCPVGQGFHLARPQPAEEIRRRLGAPTIELGAGGPLSA